MKLFKRVEESHFFFKFSLTAKSMAIWLKSNLWHFHFPRVIFERRKKQMFSYLLVIYVAVLSSVHVLPFPLPPLQPKEMSAQVTTNTTYQVSSGCMYENMVV